MKYTYKAKTKDGLKGQEGTIEAPNKNTALGQLRSSGLFVYSLVPVSQKGSLSERFASMQKISIGEKVKFTDQLASMLNAGLSITKSLEILSTQTKNKKMAKITKNTLSEVEGGVALSKALQNQGSTFSPSYLSLVRAGEASGKLDEVMRRLADTLEKQREFNSKVKGAMIYPAIISTAMVGVFFLIVVFVIPKMSAIYESFDIDLPFMTKALISLSDFLVNWWWIAISLIAGTFFALKTFIATDMGELLAAKLSLKAPIFGSITKQSSVVEFTRTLGLLDEAGVPIIEALGISKNAMKNRLFRDSIDRFIDDVKHGYPLSQSIAKEKIYPQMVSQMLIVGEKTGRIDKVLERLTDFYTMEMDNLITNLTSLMEPLIMVILGVGVGIMVAAIIMPMYNMAGSF